MDESSVSTPVAGPKTGSTSSQSQGGPSGERLMFCMACGIELPHGANFCWKCGRAVSFTQTVRAAKPSIVELCCPRCAGKLEVSSDMSKLTCASCGSGLFIVRDDKTVTVRDEAAEAAKQRADLCKAIIAEFQRRRERSVLVTLVDEDPVVLVRGLRRVLLAQGIHNIRVITRQGNIYLARQ